MWIRRYSSVRRQRRRPARILPENERTAPRKEEDMETRESPTSARRRHARRAGVGIVAACVLALAACGSSGGSGATGNGSSSAGGDPLAQYKKNGINLVYITNPPYSMADPATGKVTGAGPDIITKILNNLGITKLTYTNVDFAGEIPAITSGRADLSGNNFNENPDRCKQIGFSNPVAIYQEGALVAKGNPKNVHSYEDIVNNKSVKIAATRGDAEVSWLQTLGVPNSRISQFATVAEAVTAVNQGRADVNLNVVISLVSELKRPEGSKLELAAPFTQPVINGTAEISSASYAIPYKNVALLNGVNQQISAMIKSGEMGQILTKYGYPDGSIPPASVNAKTICPDGAWPAGYVDVN
jgi:polar amino acid transport system substrate-binding protein